MSESGQKKGVSPLLLLGGLAAAAILLKSRGGGSKLGPVQIVDVQAAATNARYKDSGILKRREFIDWEKITGITLHQVGVSRVGVAAYPKMTAHLAVHHDGTIYVIHPLNTMLWASHGFNRDTVAIEVAGLFGKDTPIPAAQANGLRQAIRLIQRAVAKKGGRISFIYGHRQSSNERLNDPQVAIWQAGALWAEQNLGLKTVPYHTRGTGHPISYKWDPRLASADAGMLDAASAGEFDGSSPDDEGFPLVEELDAEGE